MTLQLQGKICLVTGAGRGIGRSIARRFAEEGAIVYANVRKEGVIESWSAELPESVRTRIIPIYFNLTDRDALKQAVLRIKKEQGRIDVLVNNAGIAYNERIGMIAYDRVAAMFEVNVFAVIELIQLVSRLMTRQCSGSIINISSMVGVHGDKGQSAYAASKGAMIALTKSAAKELAPSQIRVNSVAPGLTETEMYHETDEKFLAERLAHIGMKRLAQPDDIANACVFLASDQSVYITGQVLGVDGSAIL
jgi:3-oxoacyl-[acyl-carrier protein] reductase